MHIAMYLKDLVPGSVHVLIAASRLICLA